MESKWRKIRSQVSIVDTNILYKQEIQII